MYHLNDYARIAREYLALQGEKKLCEGRDSFDFAACSSWVRKHRMEEDYLRFEESRLGPRRARESAIHLDISKNQQYYSAVSDQELCDCEGCKNYRKRIRQCCPGLAAYMAQLGMDIEKPYEVSVPYLEPKNGRLIYDLCFYVAFGECDFAFQKKLDGAELCVALFNPNSGVKEEHTVLQLCWVELPYGEQ